MIVWAIANQKGGVGKTTTTVSLGGMLAERGKRVLLIDTDPHASLTYYFNIDGDDGAATLYDLFMAGKDTDKTLVDEAIRPTQFDNLAVLPATMALATLDRKLGSQSGMGLLLRRVRKLVASDFDYILIDVPPILGVLMINALAAADRVIVPVQTEFLALKGLDRMMSTLRMVQDSKGLKHNVTIVPTMYDKRTKASLEAYQALRRQHGRLVWNGMIPTDTKFRDASTAQTPISMYAKGSRGAFAYKGLLTSLLSQGESVREVTP
ncbi:ParA family protein [Aliidiomarina maris]|uniref:Chromosome partitioning protein n=1 Tax=Aliidiomarina maris TaxID=531312 RepID=A0A327XAS0_9GAMM|nr:ParA family protein [Aliidiomarina maris]RAK00767.1 chromosome partitioning protein [Aliidiomarina maris]RUO27235.1 cobalamin biosynthesis protein CobQ [Aliidiomarina maris]